MHGHAARTWLEGLYRAAIRTVDGRQRVEQVLRSRADACPSHLVAIGKAAPAMAQGAEDACGPFDNALIVAAEGGCAWLSGPLREHCREGSHPLPGPPSLAAGEALIASLERAPANARFLFLISGGASALVEHPAPGLDGTFLERANRWLLGSGLDIEQINRVRKRLSRLKGGQLRHWLGRRAALALVLSDVPGDDPSVVGSGLLAADAGPAPDADLPPWLATAAAREVPAAPGTPLDVQVVGTLSDALESVTNIARGEGMTVHRQSRRLAGDAVAAGRRVAWEVMSGAPGLYVYGGETTVTLPDDPGQGGRCQSLALAAAETLAGTEGIYLLAAGTDGFDGPSGAAGAIVDGGTCARGGPGYGADAATALSRADAGTFLAGSGDLLEGGFTGTNVTDVVLAVKEESPARPG